MIIDDDLDAFIDLDDFAVTAAYTSKVFPHPSSKTLKIDGIPRYSYIESNRVQGYHTTFKTKNSHFKNLQEGDFLKLENVEYTVVDWEQDSTKRFITLVLQKV